jgi:HYR domain
MAQQQTTTTTGGTGAATTPSQTTPLTPLTPPLTLQEQQQQTRLQNVIASTTLNLQETQKQISGTVYTPRWSEPVWVNANSVAVLIAYCLPGEFADSGQEILGGFELEILESYAVALPQGFMAWMAVVGNEDLQNRRFPAALGVICASDLNKPETRVLSPQKQQEINNINQQFVNIQNTQITDIDNIINVINTVTTTTTTTPATPTPTTPRNATGAGTAVLPSSRDTIPPVLTVPPNYPLDATSAGGAVEIYALTAQDNVDGTARLENFSSNVIQDNVGGNIAISCTPPSGSVLPIGTTTVQCSATDAAGNRGTASFTVTVRAPASSPAGSTADTTPPTFIGFEDAVFTATSEQTARVTYTATAEDNVDGTAKLEADGITVTQDNVGGNIAISCTPPSGSELLTGETILTCVITDQAGNAFTGSGPITVTVTPREEVEGETAQAEEEEPPSPPPAGEEEGEGETTDAEALLLPPAGEEQQPPASEEEGEGGEGENEGEPSEE